MKITVITLNYNGAESTIKLLESLQNQTDSDFSVIVADNGSLDVQQLRDFCSGKKNIHLIENGSNLGYAGGNNPAIKYAFKNNADPTALVPGVGIPTLLGNSAGASWVVILNNDTRVAQDFIVTLKNNLIDKKGLVGLPTIELNGHGHTGRAGIIEWLKPELKHTNNPQSLLNISNLYVMGDALLISRAAFEKLGPLDENYFLYFEDADYSLKALRAGIPIDYLSAPNVQHHGSASTKKLGSPLLLRYHYRNALYFNFKNAPLLYKIGAIFWSVFIFIKQTIKLLLGNHPTESRAIMAGVVDFYQERMGYISQKIKVGIECEQIEGEIWGVGKIITKLLENIASRPELEKDFEFHLYFKKEIPKLSFLENPIFHKKIIDQPFQHKSFVIYYYVLLPIQLWFERLDVMFFPNYMLPIIFFGNSLVMMTEDIYYEMRSKQQRFHHRLAYRVFATWATWRANKIMAISETSKKELVRLFNIKPERIVVNHLAVDVGSAFAKASARLLHKESEYLLYVGQAFPRRHLKETILAFEKFNKRYSHILKNMRISELKLIAIGPDKYQTPTISYLVRKVNTELGREAVIHKDYVSQNELNRLYAEAKALIYISDREAFGLPPMEALAFGVPAIIADNSLGHELFGDNAVFVTNPDSVDEIATALREAMTNSVLREKIKGHASEIVGRYTWKAHTDRFLENIKSMTRHA